MTAASDPETRTIAKLGWRVVPLLSVVLFFNFLDKVNIGFAALQMNRALGLSNTALGLAAGVFAAAYALATIPSTLLLQKVGARRWISLIMVVWGLCSCATAFVSRPGELLLVRGALGVAEAGFAPGLIYYLSCWFPSEYRGRVLAASLLILPLSIAIGGPLSSVLLSWDGLWGLSGWRWLFLVEGLPPILLAGAVLALLADTPQTARWLSRTERTWLLERLAQEQQQAGATAQNSIGWRALFNARLARLTGAYLGIAASGAGSLIFLPLLIRSMGFSIVHAGTVAALPALIATCCFPLWGMWTDRSRTREVVVIATCTFLACGLWGAAALLPSVWALAPLSLAFIGYFGSVVPFWTLPPQFLSRAHMAAGIALINVAGNLGSFLGPVLVGRTRDVTQSWGTAVAVLAIPAALAGAIMIFEAQRARSSLGMPAPSELV